MGAASNREGPAAGSEKFVTKPSPSLLHVLLHEALVLLLPILPRPGLPIPLQANLKEQPLTDCWGVYAATMALRAGQILTHFYRDENEQKK